MAKKGRKPKLPIKHWSHSSLMAFLRNPLAWYKRYVEEVYDTPMTPSSIVGRAGHKALEHFYGLPRTKPDLVRGGTKESAIQKGLEYLRSVADFEINFGRAKSRRARRARRAAMEREYLQAIGFYLEKPPRHKVVGVEVKGLAYVEGLPIPLKAVSDLVVESKKERGALDIVDHKFVDSFSTSGAAKPLFIFQAIFNYYVVRELFGRPVRQFIIYECKKSRNANGRPQLRRYAIDYAACEADFEVFVRLLRDATEEIARKRVYLPNPSDMFEGENSFAIYKLALVEEDV